jgi:cytochrome c oxidase subunit 2
LAFSKISPITRVNSLKILVFRSVFVFLLLALSATVSFAEIRTENLWWLPDNVTVGGKKIDVLFYFIFFLTTAVFVATFVVQIWFMIKYRARRGVKARYTHGNNTLEVVWTTIPAVIFIGLFIWSNRLWNQLRHSTPPVGALQVDILAEQYGWNLRYPGPDGVLGKTDSKKVDPIHNKYGLDLADPASRDDFITYNDFTIPVGKPVHVILKSRDVIHAFYVPEFRLYQDLVPGSTISWVWFETTRTGTFAIACNQLCGSGHYNMQSKADVVTEEAYATWFAAKAKNPAAPAIEQAQPLASATAPSSISTP